MYTWEDFYGAETKTLRITIIRDIIGRDAASALKALMRIYANQTADEQSSEETKYHNNIGFTGADAHILTSYAKQFERRGSLSPKQMGVLFKRIPKYAKQLEGVTR